MPSFIFETVPYIEIVDTILSFSSYTIYNTEMAESTRAAIAKRALRDQLFNITTEKVVLSATDWLLGEKLLSNIYKLTRETDRKDGI